MYLIESLPIDKRTMDTRQGAGDTTTHYSRIGCTLDKTPDRMLDAAQRWALGARGFQMLDAEQVTEQHAEY